MSRRGVAGVVAAAAAVMVALVVAASSPGNDLLSRPRATVPVDRDTVTLPATPSEVPTSTTSTSAPLEGWNPSTLLGALLQVLAVLLVASAVVLLVAAVRALVRRTTPHVTTHGAPTFAAPQPPEELLANAEQRMEGLRHGTPRNAIVAAWMSLEDDAAQCGLPRLAHETSAEYTERVLRTWEVDAARIQELARLYREARFSRHEIGEGQRERAIDALQVVHADLARAASAPTGGDGP